MLRMAAGFHDGMSTSRCNSYWYLFFHIILSRVVTSAGNLTCKSLSLDTGASHSSSALQVCQSQQLGGEGGGGGVQDRVIPQGG